MSFLFRDFGIIRVKTLTMIINPVTKHPSQPIKEVINHSPGDLEDERSDLSEGDYPPQPMVNNMMTTEMDNQEEVAEEELYQIDNHYVLYAFYEDFKCLSHGEFFVHLRL